MGDAGRGMKWGGEVDGNNLLQISTSWLHQVLHPCISLKHISFKYAVLEPAQNGC